MRVRLLTAKMSHIYVSRFCSSGRRSATGQGRQSSSLHRQSSQQPGSMASQAGADAAVTYDIPLAHDLKDIR